MKDSLPIRDKMAIVFSGIVGGMDGHNGVGSPSNISDCAKTIKYNIMSTYDCDVFAHSWSTTHEDEVKSLYNPIMLLFQEQEYFGFSGLYASEHPTLGQAFRSTSHYVSLERAMKLKQQYENENNFRYKWVFALRYDLVFFNKLNLSILNNDMMYVCREPHWGDNISLIDDRLFLSNSYIIDELSHIGSEALAGMYNLSDVHGAVAIKIGKIFNGDYKKVGFEFKRYIDVEIYRVVISPQQSQVGHLYGAAETTPRFNKLLKEINENIKT